MAYSSAYGGGTPASQGAQGQQGASQQPDPDSIYGPSRASLWTPAPASSQSQPQRTQAASSSQQQSGNTQAASGSPVTANGQIAPAAAPASSPSGSQGSGNTASQNQPQGQQQTASPSTSAPATTGPPLVAQPPDPFVAQGGGFWTGQQWVPKNHPLATSTQGNPAQPGSPGQQPSAPLSPYGPYPGRPQDTTYQAGTLNQPQFQNYQGTEFQGYGGVDQSGIQGQQNQLLSQILSNPAMSASVVEQLKAKQRESAMAMGGQQQQMAAQNAASRGANLDTQFNNTQNQIGNSMRDSILGSYRDIDINAAMTNRQGQLDALGMSDNVLSGQVGRQGNQYQSYLSGQGAQQNENQQRFNNQFRPAEFNMERELQQEGLKQAAAGSALDSHKTDLGAYFDNQNNNLQRDQLNTQRDLGMGGLDIDRQRVANQSSQFGQTHNLNLAQFANDMYMGRAGLGLNYAQLQQQGQNETMRNILGI